MGSPSESRAGLFGLGEQRIDLGSALDELSDAELARLRWSEGDVGVLGEFAAGVEREDEAASEAEDHDRANCAGGRSGSRLHSALKQRDDGDDPLRPERRVALGRVDPAQIGPAVELRQLVPERGGRR